MARFAISTSPGPTPRGAPGQVGKGSTHLIKVAVEAAVGKRDHVAVYGADYPTPDGTCIRDYIHVSDLAAAHVAALEWLVAHPDDNLVVNCGYGDGLSVLQVLDAVDRANGSPIERRSEGRRAGDPPQLVAGNARMLATLDWRPAYADIDTIVGHALAWERKLAAALGAMSIARGRPRWSAIAATAACERPRTFAIESKSMAARSG